MAWTPAYKSWGKEQRKKLQDLSPVLQEVTTDKADWCYTYCERKEIGQAIYEDFLAYTKNKTGNENVFAFSEDLAQKGILSQLQGFQVLAMLIEEFDLSFNKETKERLRTLLVDILDELDTNGFNATPYLVTSQQFNDEHRYIDTVTWFASCACSAFRLIIKRAWHVGDELKQRLIERFSQSFQYLVDSFISREDKFSFSSGWNYTKGCKVPSLYFTFAVSEVLIDIYTTFENVIVNAETQFVQDKIDAAFASVKGTDPDIDTEINQKKAQIAESNKKYIDQYNSKTPKSEEEKSLFKSINGNREPYEEGSRYAKFENQCKEAAQDIWNLVGDKITDKLFAADLVSEVTEDAIEQSGSNDALFNSMFVIGTIINAGLDEDSEDKVNYFTLNGQKEYVQALDEFDDMRDTLRLSYDKVFRLFEKIRKKGKEYKINDYVLNFDETFDPSQSENVKELRKARIRVFSLMPLLVKIKTSFSNFVFKYPQYDMQLYLERILERRIKDGKQDKWIWEADGYSSSSNYYYVSALADFFEYYEEYELKSTANAKGNEDWKKNIRDEYFDELTTPDGPIGKLQSANAKLSADVAARDEEIEALKQARDNLREQLENDPLRKALNGFIYEAIQKRMAELLADTFTKMAGGITESAKGRATNATKTEGEDGEQKTPSTDFEKSLRELTLSLISDQILAALSEEHSTDIARDLARRQQTVSDDFKEVVKLYIKQLSWGESEFAKTEGYKGLLTILQREAQQNADNKNRRD